MPYMLPKQPEVTEFITFIKCFNFGFTTLAGITQIFQAKISEKMNVKNLLEDIKTTKTSRT